MHHTWPMTGFYSVLRFELMWEVMEPTPSPTGLSICCNCRPWPGSYRQLSGKLLLDPLQQGVRGLFRAEQGELHTVVPTKDQALG